MAKLNKSAHEWQVTKFLFLFNNNQLIDIMTDLYYRPNDKSAYGPSHTSKFDTNLVYQQRVPCFTSLIWPSINLECSVLFRILMATTDHPHSLFLKEIIK